MQKPANSAPEATPPQQEKHANRPPFGTRRDAAQQPADSRNLSYEALTAKAYLLDIDIDLDSFLKGPQAKREAELRARVKAVEDRERERAEKEYAEFLALLQREAERARQDDADIHALHGSPTNEHGLSLTSFSGMLTNNPDEVNKVCDDSFEAVNNIARALAEYQDFKSFKEHYKEVIAQHTTTDNREVVKNILNNLQGGEGNLKNLHTLIKNMRAAGQTNFFDNKSKGGHTSYSCSIFAKKFARNTNVCQEAAQVAMKNFLNPDKLSTDPTDEINEADAKHRAAKLGLDNALNEKEGIYQDELKDGSLPAAKELKSLTDNESTAEEKIVQLNKDIAQLNEKGASIDPQKKINLQYAIDLLQAKIDPNVIKAEKKYLQAQLTLEAYENLKPRITSLKAEIAQTDNNLQTAQKDLKNKINQRNNAPTNPTTNWQQVAQLDGEIKTLKQNVNTLGKELQLKKSSLEKAEKYVANSQAIVDKLTPYTSELKKVFEKTSRSQGYAGAQRINESNHPVATDVIEKSLEKQDQYINAARGLIGNGWQKSTVVNAIKYADRLEKQYNANKAKFDTCDKQQQDTRTKLVSAIKEKNDPEIKKLRTQFAKEKHDQGIAKAKISHPVVILEEKIAHAEMAMAVYADKKADLEVTVTPLKEAVETCEKQLKTLESEKDKLEKDLADSKQKDIANNNGTAPAQPSTDTQRIEANLTQKIQEITAETQKLTAAENLLKAEQSKVDEIKKLDAAIKDLNGYIEKTTNLRNETYNDTNPATKLEAAKDKHKDAWTIASDDNDAIINAARAATKDILPAAQKLNDFADNLQKSNLELEKLKEEVKIAKENVTTANKQLKYKAFQKNPTAASLTALATRQKEYAEAIRLWSDKEASTSVEIQNTKYAALQAALAHDAYEQKLKERQEEKPKLEKQSEALDKIIETTNKINEANNTDASKFKQKLDTCAERITAIQKELQSLTSGTQEHTDKTAELQALKKETTKLNQLFNGYDRVKQADEKLILAEQTLAAAKEHNLQASNPQEYQKLEANVADAETKFNLASAQYKASVAKYKLDEAVDNRKNYTGPDAETKKDLENKKVTAGIEYGIAKQELEVLKNEGAYNAAIAAAQNPATATATASMELKDLVIAKAQLAIIECTKEITELKQAKNPDQIQIAAIAQKQKFLKSLAKQAKQTGADLTAISQRLESVSPYKEQTYERPSEAEAQIEKKVQTLQQNLAALRTDYDKTYNTTLPSAPSALAQTQVELEAKIAATEKGIADIAGTPANGSNPATLGKLAILKACAAGLEEHNRKSLQHSVADHTMTHVYPAISAATSAANLAGAQRQEEQNQKDRLSNILGRGVQQNSSGPSLAEQQYQEAAARGPR
jgi:hypothetical protein